SKAVRPVLVRNGKTGHKRYGCTSNRECSQDTHCPPPIRMECFEWKEEKVIIVLYDCLEFLFSCSPNDLKSNIMNETVYQVQRHLYRQQFSQLAVQEMRRDLLFALSYIVGRFTN